MSPPPLGVVSHSLVSGIRSLLKGRRLSSVQFCLPCRVDRSRAGGGMCAKLMLIDVDCVQRIGEGVRAVSQRGPCCREVNIGSHAAEVAGAGHANMHILHNALLPHPQDPRNPQQRRNPQIPRQRPRVLSLDHFNAPLRDRYPSMLTCQHFSYPSVVPSPRRNHRSSHYTNPRNSSAKTRTSVSSAQTS